MSRPSISTRPAAGVSSPAMHFKVVVFPAPEGPSRTKNSPSRTSRLRSSRATTSPYSLRIPLSESVALSFHRPERQAAHQVALDGKRQDERRDRRDQRGCGREVVVRPVSSNERQGTDGDCLGVARGQDEREDEVVPGEDERYQADRGYPRAHQGSYDEEERSNAGVPVEQCGLLELGREVLEVGAQYPHHERQGDQLVHPDHSHVSVKQAELLVDDVERDDDRQFGSEPEREQRE